MSSNETPSKLIKGLYWGSTGLISVMMLFSAYSYLTSDQMLAAFQHLGFPSYFRVELAVAKALGVVALLVPTPRVLKEWAYAGFTITFISAFIAHTSSGDPVGVAAAPIVALILLIVSYTTSKKIRK